MCCHGYTWKRFLDRKCGVQLNETRRLRWGIVYIVNVESGVQLAHVTHVTGVLLYKLWPTLPLRRVRSINIIVKSCLFSTVNTVIGLQRWVCCHSEAFPRDMCGKANSMGGFQNRKNRVRVWLDVDIDTSISKDIINNDRIFLGEPFPVPWRLYWQNL